MRTRYGVRLGIALATVALVITGAALSAGACVVGTGSSASCTDAALNACLGGLNFDGTVTFNCGGPATIDISPGAGGTGTKNIGANTTIDGGGLVTIDGGSSVRVFSVAASPFTVRNLTIANGNTTPSGNGGGIFNDGGTVTVTNSTFDHNSAAGAGGGIHNRLNSTTTVTNSTFLSNSATGSGGAISSSGGAVTVTNSTFEQNTSPFDGGGIYNSITTLTVTNSTFDHNSSGRWGGGIINIAGGTATITNSTFDHNTAVTGGGIDNRSGHLRLTNTLIANTPAGGDCTNEDTVVDGGHNLIEDASNACGLTNGVNGNIIGQDPNLSPAGLQNNGGPTQTIAVLTGSPAINAGDQSVCANTSGVAPVNGLDQRGVARPGGGLPNCTIGAFESVTPRQPAPALSPLGLLGLGLLLIGAGAFSAQRRATR